MNHQRSAGSAVPEVASPRFAVVYHWLMRRPLILRGFDPLRRAHVRASGKIAARIQDALMPLTTHFLGNDHGNRDTVRMVQATGFHIPQIHQCSGGLVPLLHIQAPRL
jgi:hypothetical protein